MSEMTAFLPSYLHLGTSLAYLFLSGYILLKDLASPLHRIGTLFFLCFSIWSGAFVVVHFPFATRGAVEIAVDVSSIGGLLYPVVLCWFAVVLGEIRSRWWLIVIAAYATGLLILQCFTPFELVAVRGDQPARFGWHIYFPQDVAGLLYRAYVYLAFFAGLITLFFIWRGRCDRPGIRRIQAKILFIGGVSSITLMLLVNWTQEILAVSGSLATDSVFLVWAGAMFYAILRYRLFRLSPQTAAEQIIGSIPEAVFLTRLDGSIVFANPASARFTGKQPEELFEKRIETVLTAPASDPQLFADASPCFEHRSVLTDSDGHQRGARISRLPVNRDDGYADGLLFIIRDTSEQDRIERDLERRERFESLATLAGGVAHDLNNLLSGVIGFVDLAIASGGADDETREYLLTVQEAFPRLTDLTRQLLTLSKGSVSLRGPHALEAIVESVVRIAGSGTSTRFEVDLPDDLDPVYVDAGQIAQVLTNLAMNARQAMGESGCVSIQARRIALPQAKGHETDTTMEVGDYVELVVSDDGPGIAPDVAERIFDPYYTTKDTGSGLGLSTSYHIMKAHGGSLTLLPSTDGACFRMLLPVSESPTPTEAVEAKTVSSETDEGGRCLLMDDDATVRRVAREMLRNLGFDVVEAASGEEATRRIIEAPSGSFRFAVLDLTVRGGGGGLDALPAIRRAAPELPVILATGYHGSSKVPPAAAMFDAVLPKPFQLKDLSEVVSAVLGGPDITTPDEAEE